jgi:hypothetical protein
MEEYIIKAHSTQANITQRELQLMGAQPSNAHEAQQLADSFARRLSAQSFQGAGDWVGLIEAVEAGHVRTL